MKEAGAAVAAVAVGGSAGCGNVGAAVEKSETLISDGKTGERRSECVACGCVHMVENAVSSDCLLRSVRLWIGG